MVDRGVLPAPAAVPPASRQAHRQVLGRLEEEAAEALLAQDCLPSRAGEPAMDLARTWLRQHLALMDSALFLDCFSLLGKSMPWAYRVHAARGFPPDFIPNGLGILRETVRRRIAAPLAEPILAVYAWLLDGHPGFLAQAGVPPEPFHRPELEPILEACLAGDLRAVERGIRTLPGPAPGLEQLYLRILSPILVEIGARWETARISAAQEHLASALVTRLMCDAYARARPDTQVAKRALVCCAPNELHQIGAWMVADLLAMHGWDARLVGADTPIPDLLGLIDEARPSLLALSICMPFNLRGGVDLIARVRRHPGARELRIMVGGHVFELEPTLASALGADGHAADAGSAARLAEQWWKEGRLAP